MKVKLKDQKKICWIREQNKTVTGSNEVTVEDTKFIRDKIKEGVLVEVTVDEGDVKKQLKKFTVPELQEIACFIGIIEVHDMRKDELIDLLAGQENIIEKVERAAEAAQKAKAEAYEELKATISEKLGAYCTLAEGDLSTQEAIDAAKDAKAVISFEGLNDEDKADIPKMQEMIDAADAKIAEAQKSLDEAKDGEK